MTRLMLAALAIAGAMSINGAHLYGQDSSKPASDQSKTTEPTADQAKNNTVDRDMMKKIRKAVVEDKSLSTYAHNVKIIAQDGKVTLKGPVRSDDEKRSVEQKAEQVAGSGNVVSQITVEPPKSKTGSR
ncbi:MAG TPA: BON domain-containing protein [Candidatus Acidoferrales bacterium]|nr:BON domain-containing protein [Candidatus Acidoferrales bacterium]